MADYCNTFAYRLRLLVEQRGHGAGAKIARLVGVHPAVLTGYMHGKHFPTLPVLAGLADVLNVSMDFLAGRIEGGNDDGEHV